MKIAIGTDHRGYEQKEFLMRTLYLPDRAIKWLDKGAFTKERTDYPIYAADVCTAIQQKEADLGVLLCGSGVGMSIAANRFYGIYAALVWNDTVARLAKEDDNANVLVIPSDFMDEQMLLKSVQSWLLATFKQGRYQQRILMIDSFSR